jgi:myo-inositol-1(or 4)-monophosphatase
MVRPFVDAAVAACIEVGKLIADQEDDEGYRSHSRGAGGDVSIGFDLMAEEVFVRHLGAFGTIYSEESGRIEGQGDALIMLDPIDGSDNLKSRFPYYGASVALHRNGATEAAVICNFANGDCFVKYHRTHCLTSLSDPEVCHNVTLHPHTKVGLFEKAPVHPEASLALIREGLKFRSPGAVALSLAYAHYVNYVLFLGKMRPYDLDAGLFMCEDLHCFQDDDLLIVSKDQAVFDRICVLFQRGEH